MGAGQGTIRALYRTLSHLCYLLLFSRYIAGNAELTPRPLFRALTWPLVEAEETSISFYI